MASVYINTAFFKKIEEAKQCVPVSDEFSDCYTEAG